MHEDTNAPLLKLALKPVDGIDEPISLLSSRNMAVGADSNKVYQWQTSYEILSPLEEDTADTEDQQPVIIDP